MSEEKKTGRAAVLADLLVEMFAASAPSERIVATIQEYFQAEFAEATIYVVEEGEYSDYRVVGLFSTRENAEFVAARSKGEVAEWGMDPGVNELRAGMQMWGVHMLRDGATERTWRCDPDYYYNAASHSIWQRSQAPAYRGQNVPDILVANVYARDEEHAVKITNEIRTRMIANNEF